MRTITQADIDVLIRQACESPRKRTIFRLHEHEEPVQRMVNAIAPGSYITPHKHQDPDKVELFNIITGRVACIQFNPVGEVEEVHFLEAHGAVKMVDIPPRTFHTLLALEPSALLEIIQGPYDAATHKNFASWAPLEDSPKASEYLLYLESIVQNWSPKARV